MTYEDYTEWIRYGCPGGSEERFKANLPYEQISDKKSVIPVSISPAEQDGLDFEYPAIVQMDKKTFNSVSKMAWTDLFLQLLKVRK